MSKAATLVMLVLVGCGRMGFGGVEDAVDGTRSDVLSDTISGDGHPAVSCMGLAPTCGPTGTTSCCESPVVTGGTFFRGHDQAADAYTDMTRPATVSTFRLDRYEVTVRRFRQFVNAGMGTQQNPPAANAGARTLNAMPSQGGWDPAWNASLAADTTALVVALNCADAYRTWTDAPGGNEDRPINCISWYEAMAFCAWDGGFLPTEAEWHYAASGGSLQRAYPWSSPSSSTTIDCTLANFGGPDWPTTACAAAGTDLVGARSPAGDGVWGQSDLAGNVFEWVLDWFATPYSSPCDDCANLSAASERVMRGGSFGVDASPRLRAAFRYRFAAPDRYDFLGVRCARTP